VRFSEIREKYKSREEIAQYLCDRCNIIGKMQFDENGKVKEEIK
jgi:hypothetical protein